MQKTHEKTNKLKETSHSLSNFCGKTLKKPSFCLQFSLCKPKPEDLFENCEQEPQRSSIDRGNSLIPRHYSSFLNEYREKTQEKSDKKLKETSDFSIKTEELRDNFGLFLLKHNQRLILARIRENSLRVREKNKGKLLGFEPQILSFVAKTLKKHCTMLLDLAGDALALLAVFY